MYSHDDCRIHFILAHIDRTLWSTIVSPFRFYVIFPQEKLIPPPTKIYITVCMYNYLEAVC